MQDLVLNSGTNDLNKCSETFIFIHSPFCGTCHLARKMLAMIEETYEQDLFYECNASLYPELMNRYQIKSVPCLLVVSKGQVIEKIYAFHSIPYMYEKISNYLPLLPGK